MARGREWIFSKENLSGGEMNREGRARRSWMGGGSRGKRARPGARKGGREGGRRKIAYFTTRAAFGIGGGAIIVLRNEQDAGAMVGCPTSDNAANAISVVHF